MTRLRRLVRGLLGAPLWLVMASAAGGCLPVRYVTQAAAGQAEILDARQDIDALVREGWLDSRTRALLSRVHTIKSFGEAHGLARTSNYESYVDLHRDAVVWVVSASEPLAFRSRSWSFPITGSITYLGWFHRQDAEAFAGELRREQLDVDLRGASAYSTLGWFADPVLSTMLYPGDEALGELADVILHESLHASFFVSGQSVLNESVASFVGNRLALEYLDQTKGACSKEKLAYVRTEREAAARAHAMRHTFQALSSLYASSLPAAQKLERKRALVEHVQGRLGTRRPINNASLLQYETYGSGEAELDALFRTCDRSWPRFFALLRARRGELGSAEPHADPAVLLQPLLRAGCPR